MNARRATGIALCFFFAFALAPVTSARVASAEDERGIRVTATGEVRAKPNVVILELATAGNAELAADAITKYRDAMSQTMTAFETLSLSNLKVQPQGMTIATTGGANPQAGGFGQANQNAKSELNISQTLRIELSDISGMTDEQLIETIGTIIDTAKDSGAAIGANPAASMLAAMFGNRAQSNSAATFVVENVDDLRQEAYRAAFEQARQRAERLAALAGAELGEVLSVEETIVPQSDNKNPQMAYIMAIYGIAKQEQGDEDRVTSDKFAEVPIRVTLNVRFALREKAGN